MADRCEQGDEPSGSVGGEELLDWLSDYWLLRRNYAPWNLVGRSVGRLRNAPEEQMLNIGLFFFCGIVSTANNFSL